MILTLATAVFASEARFGLFIGNDFGRASDMPLVFATTDAKKMRDLFVELGGMPGSHTTLLENNSRRAVEHAMTALTRKIENAEAAGAATTLVVYYSGHGSKDTLHLGSTELPHDDLRSWLEASGADVRIGLLDACQSGGAVRSKGAARGPSYDFQVAAVEARGTAFLTSSAASELSQESSEVGGGFFTHYLHTALSGAADADRDGEVTLPEAYRYVYAETAFGTRETERSQTPRFDFDLVGAGSIALTSLESANAHLNLRGDLEGTFSIWDEGRKRYVAEISGANPQRLALRPGTYYVHKRLPGWVDEARYDIREGEVRTLAVEDFVSVPYERTASRGDLNRMSRRARLPALSLRMLIGNRGFPRRSNLAREFIPGHGVLGVEARFQHPARITWVGADMIVGGGPGTLRFQEMGDTRITAQSVSVSASAGIATKPRLFRAGVGGRAEFISMARTFVDDIAPPQRSFSLAPGVHGWLGLHTGRFSLELQNHLMIMGITFTEEHPHPFYSAQLLSMGYRF